MNHKNKQNQEMTERQYKTLRKLISLWFIVVVRRRYTIFQNMALIISLIINIYFLFLKPESNNPPMASGIIIKSINIQQALDLSNYTSTSDSKKTLGVKYTKIYKIYIEDKSHPDHSYFLKNGKPDPSWAIHCRRQLIKIINIKNKIRAVEGILLKSYPEKSNEIDEASNKIEEPLADMSNYYSKFIPTEVYDNIIQTYD